MQKLSAGKSTHVVWNDAHKPYHDPLALRCAEKLICYIKPDYLHYDGDWIDFYTLSKFDKRPTKIADLQNDLNDLKATFHYHRTIFKNTEFFYELGNHDDRLRRYLWSIAKELSELDALQIQNLLSFKEYDIHMVEYEEGLKINDIFVVQHGDIVSQESSYTAKRLFAKHGGNGICGHTHRGGAYYKKDYEGLHGWWENFCLCDLNPDYTKNPNWQQGVTVIDFGEGKQFLVEQIPIIDGKCIYGGKVIEA